MTKSKLPDPVKVEQDRQDLIKLARKFSVKEVDLDWCARKLGDGLYLGLNWKNIGDVGAAIIAETLKVNSSVKHIDIAGNDIGDVGAAALAEALKVNNGVTTIDLDYNNISSTTLTQIHKQLAHNNSLLLNQLSHR